MAFTVVYAKLAENFDWNAIPDDYIPNFIPLNKIFAFKSSQLRKLRARQLYWFLLYKLFQEQQLDLNILKTVSLENNGRPEFKDVNIDFNISNSGEWVALFLNSKLESSEHRVGIDIELPIKYRHYQAMMEKYMSADEIEFLLTKYHLEQAFYRGFCIREALLKTQGIGNVGLQDVSINHKNLQIKSRHVPRGMLLFTEELPFYLACFLPTSCNDKEIKFYQFRDNKQQLQKIINYNLYQVNMA